MERVSLNDTDVGTSHDDAPRPPLTTTTSIWPAASIFILAAVMLGVFMLINAIADQGSSPTPSTVVVVGGLSVDTASTLMNGCVFADAPPSNIRPSYIVPVNTVAAGPIDLKSSDAGSYDCQRELTAPYPQSEILGFYLDQFEALGWAKFSEGPAFGHGGEQILLQKSGSDSFVWISGITVAHTSTTSTTWTLRFYQDNSID